MISIMIALSAIGSEPSIDVETLLRKHEEGLGRIHSISATLEGRYSEDNGQTWKPLHKHSIRRSGQKMRLDEAMLHIKHEGQIQEIKGFSSYLFTPDGRWSTLGIDPDSPPRGPVSMLDQVSSERRISGRIRPPEPYGPHGYKSMYLGLLLILPAEGYTLRELCEVSRNVRPVEGRTPEGIRTWDLKLSSPISDRTFEISVSPEHNYLVISRIIRSRSEDDGMMYVSDFQEVGSGVFLPRLIKGKNLGSSSILTEIELKDVEVNVPIPDSEFELRFPEGIPIADETRGDGSEIYHIWGKGKPTQTFETAAAYNNWRREQLRDAVMTKPSSWSSRFALVLVTSLVLVSLIIVRKRLSSRGVD